MSERDIWAIAGFDDAAEFRVWSYELPELAKKIISDAQVHHDVCPFRPIDVWYLEQVLEKALADELTRWQQGWGHDILTPEQARELRRKYVPGSRYHRLEEPQTDEVAVIAGAALSLVALDHSVEAFSAQSLHEMTTKDLSGIDLDVFAVSWSDLAERSFVVAFGISKDGVGHPLAAMEGDTNDGPLMTDLLVALRDRGLNTDTTHMRAARSHRGA